MIKLFALTTLVGLSMSVVTLMSGAAFLAAGGVAVCRVESPEVNLFIPIPTQLVDAGLVVASVAMPEDKRAEARGHIEPWLPMIETVTRKLAEVPDGTVLVSVESDGETVLIQRRHGRLSVDVDADDADVHVSIPARSVKRIVSQLGYLI